MRVNNGRPYNGRCREVKSEIPVDSYLTAHGGLMGKLLVAALSLLIVGCTSSPVDERAAEAQAVAREADERLAQSFAGATDACKRAVLKHLKAPSTAEFSEVKTINESEGRD